MIRCWLFFFYILAWKFHEYFPWKWSKILIYMVNILNLFPIQKLIFGHFWNCKKWNLAKKSFHEIDLFVFTSLFGLDIVKFSGPLCSIKGFYSRILAVFFYQRGSYSLILQQKIARNIIDLWFYSRKLQEI